MSEFSVAVVQNLVLLALVGIVISAYFYWFRTATSAAIPSFLVEPKYQPYLLRFTYFVLIFYFFSFVQQLWFAFSYFFDFSSLDLELFFSEPQDFKLFWFLVAAGIITPLLFMSYISIWIKHLIGPVKKIYRKNPSVFLMSAWGTLEFLRTWPEVLSLIAEGQKKFGHSLDLKSIVSNSESFKVFWPLFVFGFFFVFFLALVVILGFAYMKRLKWVFLPKLYMNGVWFGLGLLSFFLRLALDQKGIVKAVFDAHFWFYDFLWEALVVKGAMFFWAYLLCQWPFFEKAKVKKVDIFPDAMNGPTFWWWLAAFYIFLALIQVLFEVYRLINGQAF